MRKQNGFSLIELMIVVAIIGILAMIAIPSYQTYTQRARFAEVISATEPFKIAIALALQEGSPINELTNGAHGIPNFTTPTKNLSSIEVTNGTIIATATNLINNHTYSLTPNQDGSNFRIEGSCINAGLCNS